MKFITEIFPFDGGCKVTVYVPTRPVEWKDSTVILMIDCVAKTAVTNNMAITQQILRIPDSQLDACSIDPNQLHALISYELTTPEQEIDLDWAPIGMQQYFELSGQLGSVQKALALVFEGEAILNKTYPIGSNGIYAYSDITFLSSANVLHVKSEFRLINWTRLLSCMPRNKQEALQILNSDLICHPDEYYLPEIKKLVAFVEQAASQNMALVQWWD